MNPHTSPPRRNAWNRAGLPVAVVVGLMSAATPGTGAEHACMGQDIFQERQGRSSEGHFQNRYGITLAADLYLPKNRAGDRLPTLAISGPFGAVKSQASGLHAQRMAEGPGPRAA